MKKVLILIVVFIFLGCKEVPKNQSEEVQEQNIESTWISLLSKDGSKPVARHEAAFVRVGDKFYLLGGRGIRPVSIYNTATGTWSQGAEPPLELHHFQPVVHEDKIYVLGALTGGWPDEKPTKSIYIYNPATDSWIKGDAIPEGRQRGSTGNIIHGSKIYMTCGIRNGHIGDHKDWADSYDLISGEWKVLADAPRTRDHFQAVEVNGKIYALAGRNTGASDEPFGATISEVDVYDIATDSWITLPNPIPTQRAGNFSIVYENKILVLGGESNTQEKAHAEVEVLELTNHTWSTLPPMLQGRHGTGVLGFKDGLYVASGCGNRGGNPELDTMEKYGKP